MEELKKYIIDDLDHLSSADLRLAYIVIHELRSAKGGRGEMTT